MSKGLKIWLWIIFVMNIIAVVSSFVAALLAPVAFISVILSAAYVAGIALLLFKQKKMGFFLMCGTQVISIIYSIFSGANIILALVSAIIPVAIVYFLMKPNWDAFQ